MKLIELIDIQTQSSKWLYDLHIKGLLEVDDSFQRNYVWLEKHKVKLIESILIGYPIPEIYLWNTGTDSNSGDTKYSIIDGQQRLGALFQFIQNNFPLSSTHLDSSFDIHDGIRNSYFRELAMKHKQAIWSYVFSVRIVRTVVERQKIVEMFLRLNGNNMTLNPQELRNAEFEGHFLILASELSDLPFWAKNSLFGKADIRRMRDITFVSNILTFMRLGIEEEITSRNINRVYELFNEKYPNKKKDKDNFILITEYIDKIIDDDNERKKFLSRKVHLYTLINLLYGIILVGKKPSTKQIRDYRFFIDNYDNILALSRHFKGKRDLIKEYEALSKEGTNQKSNRIRRFELLKEIIK